jgi:23S rRNA (guanosine2251-2'-O)-methyltransferase
MDKKQKKQEGELVYGIHAVAELLKAKRRRVISLYTSKPLPKGWKRIELLLQERSIPIQYVPKEVLTRIAGTSDHQGVLAWAQPFVYRKKPFDPEKQKFILMLDGIQDVRNLGAILRTAYCTGVQGVIIPRTHAAPITAAALKASAGLAEHLDISLTPSTAAAVLELKRAGYHFYLATLQGEDALSCEYKTPLCIVIGSEGTGISPAILKEGTQITLAQKDEDISYNASVAAGIILFFIATSQKFIKRSA